MLLAHRVRQKCPYALSPAHHGACDLTLGAEEHRRRGTAHPVCLAHFPVFLQQDACEAVFRGLGTVLLGISPAYEGYGELLAVLLLPAPHLRQEGVARAAS